MRWRYSDPIISLISEFSNLIHKMFSNTFSFFEKLLIKMFILWKFCKFLETYYITHVLVKQVHFRAFLILKMALIYANLQVLHIMQFLMNTGKICTNACVFFLEKGFNVHKYASFVFRKSEQKMQKRIIMNIIRSLHNF